MHWQTDNKENKINDKVEEVIQKLFKSLLNRYLNNLETSMRGSDFIFDCVLLLYYKCHKINPNRSGSYIDSSDWIKHKKVTKNPINKKDNKCFQYAVTVALNHEKVGKHSEGITKIKHFINEYNWEGITFSIRKKWLEKIWEK